MRIGVLLPNTTDPRWTLLDGPALRATIDAAVPGASDDEQNANGDAAAQLAQADTGLASGDCILVVAPVDPTAAAQIATAAKARGVPVIAYDRFIESPDIAYYVGFDEVAVGRLIGQYIVDHYAGYAAARGRNVAQIGGDIQDGRSIDIHDGEQASLQPLFDNASLRKVFDQFTRGGDAATAQTEMDGVLTANNNNVLAAVTSSDALATGVIAALTAAHLNGKVLVTGAGATVEGIHALLTGDQAMTVELNPALEAAATARLVAALNTGSSTTAIVTGTTPTAARNAFVPTVLEVPRAVDKSNIASVIADGLVTAQQVCAGVAAGTAGVCP